MATVRPLPNPGKGKSLRLDNVVDFNGGLNTTANRFDLAINETPDCNNVDIDRRGGIIRRAAATVSNDASGTISGQRPFVMGPGTKGETLFGGNFKFSSLSDTGTGITLNDFSDTADVGQYWYVFNIDVATTSSVSLAAGNVYRISTAAVISSAFTMSGTSAWQDSFSSPSGTHAPNAYAAAAHNGHLIIGYTVEVTATGPTTLGAFPNRIRWSHPGDGGSWRSIDYIDVGHKNDPIVGLVSVNDHLLILKRNSVWVLAGYDADTFSLSQVTTAAGCSGKNAYVATPRGVYFSDIRKGLHLYDGNTLTWVGEKVVSYWPAYNPPTVTGFHSFSYGEYDTVALGYSRETDRVWVSLPDSTSRATDPPTNSFSLVYDPNTGAWTKNNIKARCFVQWRGKLHGLWLDKTFYVEDASATRDTYLGSTDHIDAYWVSAWHVASQPVVPKRWYKPEFVLTGNQVGTFTVSVYKDYDPITVEKTITIATTNPLSSSSDYDEVKRTQTLGTAKAVSLKFAGPTSEHVKWRLDAYTMKSRQKSVRS